MYAHVRLRLNNQPYCTVYSPNTAALLWVRKWNFSWFFSDLFNLKFNSTWPFLGCKAEERSIVEQIRLISYNLEETSNTTEGPLPLKSWNRKDDDATLPCPFHMCHHDDCACYCRCLNWNKRPSRNRFLVPGSHWYVSCLTCQQSELYFVHSVMRTMVILLRLLGTTVVAFAILPTLL